MSNELVRIPGHVLVSYGADGTVTRLAFIPAESDGWVYDSPRSDVIDGDEGLDISIDDLWWNVCEGIASSGEIESDEWV